MSIKKIIYLSLTLVMALTSCVGIDEGKDSGVGYFTINGFNVDAEVSELLPTKSGETSLCSLSVRYTAPDPSNTIFKVKKGDSVVKEWKGLPSAAIELPKGDYVLEAEFGRNDFGDAWFTDSTEVSIKDADVDSDQPVSASVTLNVANSLVSVSIDDSLREHLAADDVNVTIGSIENAELEKYYFVPAGSGLNVVLQAKNLLEQKKDFSYSMTPQARTAAEVVFRLDGSVETPTVTLGDLSEGAFQGSLYFPPASISSNISSSASLLVYELKTGDTWTPVNVSDVSGYKYISKQPDGSSFKNETTYYLRARIGNVISEEREFTPKSFAECITSSECSADHKYDGTVLTGTRVKASVGIALPSIIAELGSVSAAASFKGSDGKERSSKNVALDNENGNNEFDLTNISGWPYIPQGSDYQMTISLTCKIGEMSIDVESTKQNINVPKPEFVVTACAETSYSRYIAKSSNMNDSGTGDKVMNIKGVVSISNDILKESHYSRTATLTYDGLSMLTDPESVMTNEFRPNTLADANKIDGNIGLLDKDNSNVINQDWGTHIVSASFMFDDVEALSSSDPNSKISSVDCHITGLPYSYNFVDGSLDEYKKDGWTTNGTLRVSNIALTNRPSTLVLQHQSAFGANKQNGFVVSPKFHIPSKGVSVQASVHRSTYTSSGNKERTGYIGAVATPNTSNTSSITYTTKGGNNTEGEIYGKDEWMTAFSMTNDTPYISIDSDDWSSGGWDAVYYFLHEAHFRYNNQ